MKPEAYLELAQALAQGLKDSEARSAISRAYYAAFHVVYVVQRELGALPSVSHDLVSDRFINATDREVRRLGRSLLELRQRRNDADYKLQLSNVEDPQTAQVLVRLAQDIILEVVSADADLRRAMGQAIKEERQRRGR